MGILNEKRCKKNKFQIINMNEICLSNLKVNSKYYITIIPPFRINPYYMRVIIHELIATLNSDVPNYINFTTLLSSKDIITECGLNNIIIPLPCVQKIETLHEILNKIFIDDVIFLIEQYI